jgi:hypothetical protein
MRKIVSYSILYMSIFYLKVFEYQKTIFDCFKFESIWKI